MLRESLRRRSGSWDMRFFLIHLIAPSDYHLFRSLQNFLNEKVFNDFDEIKSGIEEFIKSKPPEFFRNGIEKLVTKWQQVIDNDRQYLINYNLNSVSKMH